MSRYDGRLLGKHIAQYREEVENGGFIPKLGPSRQVRMVDAPLRVNMLTRPDHHGLSWRDIT